MIIFKFLVTLPILVAVEAGIKPETTAESANARMYKDFIGTLYKAVGEAQVNNIYNMVKVFSVSTVEQAQQVVQYIDEHSNLTKSESATLRMAGNASVEIGDCIFKKEIELLQAFRHTGYNLHNCIRSAQMNYEKAYVELNAKLDQLKAKAIAAYRSRTRELQNCNDSECYMKVLVQSIVQFESMREELNKEKMEANNLTSRYLVTSIAMGCVSSSLQQIHRNYQLGKEMMARCFHAQTEQSQISQQQEQQRQQQQQQQQQHQHQQPQQQQQNYQQNQQNYQHNQQPQQQQSYQQNQQHLQKSQQNYQQSQQNYQPSQQNYQQNQQGDDRYSQRYGRN